MLEWGFLCLDLSSNVILILIRMKYLHSLHENHHFDFSFKVAAHLFFRLYGLGIFLFFVWIRELLSRVLSYLRYLTKKCLYGNY